MNDDELLSHFDKIDATLEIINDKINLMATKGELLEVQAVAQEASFTHNKFVWLISCFIGAIAFLVGYLIP